MKPALTILRYLKDWVQFIKNTIQENVNRQGLSSQREHFQNTLNFIERKLLS